MTPKEQATYLGLDKLNALDKLNIILNGNFQITGSLALFEYGIIKRDIKDLDIVVPSLETIKHVFNSKKFDFQEWFDYSDEMEDPKHTVQKRGKVTNRISFVLDDVFVCAFYGKDQKYKVVEFMVGRRFKISHPSYAIKAKKKYVMDILKMEEMNVFQIDKISKHMADIIAYQKRVLSVPVI